MRENNRKVKTDFFAFFKLTKSVQNGRLLNESGAVVAAPMPKLIITSSTLDFRSGYFLLKHTCVKKSSEFPQLIRLDFFYDITITTQKELTRQENRSSGVPTTCITPQI